MERYVAIDGVCAWPNLTMLPNGEIVATIFNQPCHGRWEGDVECWASKDGRFWEKRGVVAPHEPGTNRMNVSAGLTCEGDLIVLASGWTNRPPAPEPLPVFPHDEYKQPAGSEFRESRALCPWVCRSIDGGHTWTHDWEVAAPPGAKHCVPFGDIIPCEDGTLCTTWYFNGQAWFVRGREGGKVWDERYLIAKGFNETDILDLGGGRWIAAARSAADDGTALFRSDNNGETWGYVRRLTLPLQYPGHLLRMKAGRILFCFGIRTIGLHGVGAVFSENDGDTWANSRLLVQYDANADGGYPSSVQIEDGTIVTAYYSSNTPDHQRYHMGVVRWKE